MKVKQSDRETELRSLIRHLDGAQLEVFAYLGRLYVQRKRAPSPETASEIARMEHELREYAAGVADLPIVLAPAIRL